MLFPNADNIYLHGTPSQHLFARRRRDFSHGCIRLERPEELAHLIASKATRAPAAQFAARRASGTEHFVKLNRVVPVYILYFTVWVGEDGTTRFHHDVYGHDEQLEPERRRASQPLASRG